MRQAKGRDPYALAGRQGPGVGRLGWSLMTPRRLAELDKGERRRAWLRTVAVLVLAWTVLIAVYYLVPAGVVPSRRHFGLDAFLHLGIAIALFVMVLAGQARRIVAAELPELRAVEALGVIIPLFLVIFAASYLSLSNSSVHMFSEQLDHTRALYFAITVFSTVGFGDITPTTDLARIVVSVPMLLDLVIIGAVVRLILNAAQAGLARARGGSDES
jgi:voltage-gated potassium channel